MNDGVASSVSAVGSGPSPSLSDGAWHHLAVVRNGATGDILFYVDGVEQELALNADLAAGLGSATAPLTMGYLDTGGANTFRFDGSIDEVGLYDRALPSSEIENHYDAGLAGKSVDTLRPVAIIANVDPTVTEGATVTLDGTGSTGNIATYLWEQTGSGTMVVLTPNASGDTATFTAPSVGTSGETLTFRLTVADSGGGSSSATTTVTVNDSSTPPVVPGGGGDGGGGGCFISSIF